MESDCASQGNRRCPNDGEITAPPSPLEGSNQAAVEALLDVLENEVAALVLKILVKYQVADIAGDPIRID